MVLWDIERAEVMKVIFNFRAQLYLKAGLSKNILNVVERLSDCLLYTSPSPRD